MSDNEIYIDVVRKLVLVAIAVGLFSLCIEVSMTLGDLLASL